MKHWRIDYTIEYIDGRKEERDAVVEARNIAAAVCLAVNDVTDPLRRQLEVSRAVIWNVGIMEDNVFPEEGEGNDL
jgi:hypothetical protein